MYDIEDWKEKKKKKSSYFGGWGFVILKCFEFFLIFVVIWLNLDEKFKPRLFSLLNSEQ